MVEQTVFLSYLGENPTLKIFEFLIETREVEHMLSDIVKETRVNRKRGFQILNSMIERDDIFLVKTVRHLKFYKLNIKKKSIKALVVLFDMVLKEYLEGQTK